MNATLGLPVVLTIATLVGVVVLAVGAGGLFVLLRRRKRHSFRIAEEDNDRLARHGGHLSISDFHKIPVPSWKPSLPLLHPVVRIQSASKRWLRRRKAGSQEIRAQRAVLRKSIQSDMSPAHLSLPVAEALPPQPIFTKLTKPMLGPRPAPMPPARESMSRTRKRNSEPSSYRRPMLPESNEPLHGPRSLIVPRCKSVSSRATKAGSQGPAVQSKVYLAVRPSYGSNRPFTLQQIGEAPDAIPPSPPRSMAPYDRSQHSGSRSSNRNTRSIDSFLSVSSSVLNLDSSHDVQDKSAVAALEASCHTDKLDVQGQDSDALLRSQLPPGVLRPKAKKVKAFEASATVVRPSPNAQRSFHAKIEREILPRNDSSSLSMRLMTATLTPDQPPTPEKRGPGHQSASSGPEQAGGEKRSSRCSRASLKRSSRQLLPVIKARERRLSTPSVSDYSRRPSPLGECFADRPTSVFTESAFHFEPYSPAPKRSSATSQRHSAGYASQAPAADYQPIHDISESNLTSIWLGASEARLSTPASDSSLHPRPLRTSSKVLPQRISQLLGEQHQPPGPHDEPPPERPQNPTPNSSPPSSPPRHARVASSVYPEDASDWQSLPASPCGTPPPPPPTLPSMHTIYAAQASQRAAPRRSPSPLREAFAVQEPAGPSQRASTDVSVSPATAAAIGDLASQLRRMDSLCDARSDAGYFDLTDRSSGSTQHSLGAAAAAAAAAAAVAAEVASPLEEISGNRRASPALQRAHSRLGGGGRPAWDRRAPVGLGLACAGLGEEGESLHVAFGAVRPADRPAGPPSPAASARRSPGPRGLMAPLQEIGMAKGYGGETMRRETRSGGYRAGRRYRRDEEGILADECF